MTRIEAIEWVIETEHLTPGTMRLARELLQQDYETPVHTTSQNCRPQRMDDKRD